MVLFDLLGGLMLCRLGLLIQLKILLRVGGGRELYVQFDFQRATVFVIVVVQRDVLCTLGHGIPLCHQQFALYAIVLAIVAFAQCVEL